MIAIGGICELLLPLFVGFDAPVPHKVVAKVLNRKPLSIFRAKAGCTLRQSSKSAWGVKVFCDFD